MKRSADVRLRGGAIRQRLTATNLANVAGAALAGNLPAYAARVGYEMAKKKAVETVKKAFSKSAVKSRLDQRRRYRKQPQRGTSAGFIRGNNKKDEWKQFTSKGIVITKEAASTVVGTTLFPSYPVYVGHATHGDIRTMRKLFFRCVLKELFRKAGISILNFELESPGTYNIVVSTQNAINPAFSASPFTVVTTGSSYEQISATLLTNWEDYTLGVNESNATSCSYVNSLTLLNGTIQLSKLDCRDATVVCKVKTDLKIQNRTVTTGTDDDVNSTENVANQPLVGKTYIGKGSGLVPRLDLSGADSGKLLNCNNATGTLKHSVPAGVNEQMWLREPPLPTLFLGNPKYGKVRIEPGDIKTSVMEATIRIKQIDFWNYVRVRDKANAATPFNERLVTIGKFKIMALEKIIAVSASDTVPTVGFENNMRMGMYLTYPRSKVTGEIYEQQFF